MFQLIRLQWLSFLRSPSFQKDLIIKIFLGLVGIYILFNLYAIATNLEEIIQILKLDIAPIDFANRLVLYYFFSELVLRYFMQTVPVLDVEPFLHLPLKRSLIGRFIVVKSVLSFYNVLAIVLFLPIAFDVILPVYGASGAISWFLLIFLFSIALHFFNILFKKRLDDKKITWIIIAAIVMGSIALDYVGMDLQIIPINFILEDIQHNAVWLLLPLLLAGICVYLCFSLFSNNLYLEDMNDQKLLSNADFTDRFSKWENKGIINSLIIQELKLILRHKRSRSTLILSLVFILYPLLLINRDDSSSEVIYILASIFCSGSFILNYGQFLWSWNTNQMDFFLTKINPYTAWLESRYRLLLYSAVVLSVLSIPYFLIDYKVLLAIVATSFFNVGINVPLIMRLSLWGPKPIDLNKSSMMNFQGTGAAQFVLGIPVILGPLIVYAIGAIPFNELAGFAAVAVVGIIGIFCRGYFFKQIAKKLKNDKYALIANLNL